jgi:UDP-hydrolysing UDP-N-acetyl-D-glucosamine 2-epimerase
MIKNICVVTATRAEYGLLKPLMDLVKSNEEFKLQTLVTGAHLSPEFGLTYKVIESDGFRIDEKVEMLVSSDSATGIVKSMGLGMISFAESFHRLQPDALIILGDRFEMLSIAAAASVFKIPIVHLHGGEITEGAYDDSFRHAITKLSHIHFASTEKHRNRIIQLGENPNTVFNVGAIGIDNILNLKLLSKKELENQLDFQFQKYNYHVSFHPETLSTKSSSDQFQILLKVIEDDEDSLYVFTKANADTDGRIINNMIDDFVKKFPKKAVAFTSLGSLRYLSLLKQCNAIIGNSSSGIIEAPSLKMFTINIGDRQKGRTQADSVINCEVDFMQIKKAISQTKENKPNNFNKLNNPYGQGNTALKILKILQEVSWNSLTIKRFYNLS